LLSEWPASEKEPTKYFLGDLPAQYTLRRLVRLAKCRGKIEQDYQQLKQELGLDHYEGRSWIGWHHHATLVMLAHAFLTLETLRSKKNFWVDPATDAPDQKPQVHLAGIEDVITDKGYHSGAVLVEMKGAEVRTYIPEKKQKGHRHWEGKREEQQAVYANRRRMRGVYGKQLLRKRGELLEQSFAHRYDTGGMRRTAFGTREHSEAAVDSRGCVQSEPDLPHLGGIGHPAGVEEPTVLAYFCVFFGYSVASQHRRAAHTILSRRHGSADLEIITILSSNLNSATETNRVAPRAASLR